VVIVADPGRRRGDEGRVLVLRPGCAGSEERIKPEAVASSLLRASAPPVGLDVWPALHSAWLCPQIPFAFDFGLLPHVDAPPAPQPV